MQNHCTNVLINEIILKDNWVDSGINILITGYKNIHFYRVKKINLLLAILYV